MNRSSCPPALLLIPLVLACVAVLPQARAVCREGCDFTGSNTALGEDALVNNTTGILNTAIGAGALFSNTTGTNNTADGAFALQENTTGNNNTANGLNALNFNTIGSANTATGLGALSRNGTGNKNTASGLQALSANTTGSKNTADGVNALLHNKTGSFNIALGADAGLRLTNGDNNIDIGNVGFIDEANTVRIGTVGIHNQTFIAGISGATVPSGVPVIIDTDGHLGTATSSARYKDAIKPMDKASEAILALKPVTFHYKHKLDPDSIPQFGLIAEEVEKVNPDLVARDAHGKPYTVRYEAVNAMLLNEFLKEHQTVQELKKQVAALTAGLQRVNEELELSKSVPRTVQNSR